MMDNDEVLHVGRWSVGLDRKTGATILRLEFQDRQPVTLMSTAQDAQDIARAISEQYARPLPTQQ